MTKKRLHSILLALLCMGMSVQGFSAHWAWVEQEVAPVPWDHTAFPMFMAYDKSDQKLTLVINDLDDGTVQVWKFIGSMWTKISDGVPDLGSLSDSYHFRSVENLYYDENLDSLAIWGYCAGYQFETGCHALFNYCPGQGFTLLASCISVSADAWTYPALSAIFDTKRMRAVFVGSFRGRIDDKVYNVTIEFDGHDIIYVPNISETPGFIQFGIGTAGYDANSGKIVFYGRRYPEMPIETWEYNGLTWTLVPTDSSPPMWYPIIGMIYVPDLGGLLAMPNDAGPIDTWVYRDKQWKGLPISGISEGRVKGLMCLDPTRQLPVFYGGIDEHGDFVNQMWKLQCAAHCKPVSKP